MTHARGLRTLSPSFRSEASLLPHKPLVLIALVVAGALLAATAWLLAFSGDDHPAGDDGENASQPESRLPPIEPAETPVGPCTHPVGDEPPVERWAGDTPAGSAACAAFAAFTEGADRAVVATGSTAALLAAPLATSIGGPVLLVGDDELPGETVTALRDLGVAELTVVGDPSQRLVTALGELARVHQVIAAEDPAALSLTLAERTSDQRRLFVTGPTPGELLVAAAAAVHEDSAVVVLDRATLPRVVELAGAYDEVRVVGHPSVVPDHLVASLRDVATVVRTDGPTTAGTAAGIARMQPRGDGPIHLVDLRDLDHAVAAAWLAPRLRGPVLFSDGGTLPRATTDWLRLGELAPSRSIRLLASATRDPVVAALTELAAAVAEGPPPAQVRGAWAHLFDDSLKTREGITAFLDTAANSRLNTVIVQVARRQDAYYASAVLPRTTDPGLEPGLDVLAELLPRAHARGLEVHAWFAVVQAWHPKYEGQPSPDGWVWIEHGPGSDDPWVTRPHPDRAAALGYPEAFGEYPYLDLGVPAVHDHIVQTLVEVAGRYPVDAIHLDYLRYPGKDWGYHPVALRRFSEQSGLPADTVPAVDDPGWSEWRRQQATTLAQRIHTELEAVRPGLEISAAVIAQGEGPTSSRPFRATLAYEDKMQDWVSWAQNGLLDLTIPMAYFDQRRYPDRYAQWVGLARQLSEGGARTAIGQGSWLNPSAMSLAQAEEALRNTDGLVLYSYQQDTWCPAGTTETGDPCEPVEPPTTLWRQLADGPFATAAPPR